MNIVIRKYMYYIIYYTVIAGIHTISSEFEIKMFMKKNYAFIFLVSI